MEPGRPVVLTFLGHYLPSYKAGGPIRTIVNLVDQLGEEFAFHIVTADRDFGERSRLPGIVTNQWVARRLEKVFYRTDTIGGWIRFLRSIPAVRPDVVYVNSYFSLSSSIVPVLLYRLGVFGKVNLIVAPRGEFSPGALAIKSGKKRLFLALAAMLKLHRTVIFQASSHYEANDIATTLQARSIATALDVGPSIAPSSIAVAPNLAPVASRRSGVRTRADASLSVVFLSRISPKKNLLGAFDILSRIRDLPITFDIYGILEDRAYWARCEAAMASLPPNVQVSYRGPLRPHEVEPTLARYDAFLFPTLGENYGHVIREALSAGLPVLVSDRTPWRGLEARGAGADLPLEDPEAFADRIRAWADLPQDRFERMRAAARALGDDPETARQALEANRRMFLGALHRNR